MKRMIYTVSADTYDEEVAERIYQILERVIIAERLSCTCGQTSEPEDDE